MRELLAIALSEEDVKIRLDAIKTALARGGFGDRTNIEVEMGAHTLAAWETTFAKSIRRLASADDGDRTVDKYSAVEAGTVDDVVDAVVVLDSDNGEPVEYVPKTRTPADYGSAAPHESSDDTPPESVRRRMPNAGARTTEWR